MDEMHLPEVGLGRVASHPRAVLDGPPQVRVAFHPETGQESDALLVALAERVVCAAAHSNHGAAPVRVSANFCHVVNLSTGRPRGAAARSAHPSATRVRSRATGDPSVRTPARAALAMK